VLVVILNLESANARAAREEIGRLFRDARIDADIRETTPGNIETSAREALQNHPQAVVAAGGDGTVSTVAAVLAGTSMPLGVLPLGALNHFARDVGVPGDLAAAVQLASAHRVRLVDAGCINNKTFINNASIGVYPSVVERRDQLRQNGHTKWRATAAATLEVLRAGSELAVRLKAERTEIVARTPFLFVGNNQYLVEGVKLGARTKLDEGRLYAYYAPPVRTQDLPILFARSLSGRVREHTLRSLSSAELWVDALHARDIKVACDGEVLTCTTPLHYRSWPRALAVLSPPDADDRSPL
jgi:diacylglycerol kinase family enzyme